MFYDFWAKILTILQCKIALNSNNNNNLFHKTFFFIQKYKINLKFVVKK